jgi:hypothetical protein
MFSVGWIEFNCLVQVIIGFLKFRLAVPTISTLCKNIRTDGFSGTFLLVDVIGAQLDNGGGGKSIKALPVIIKSLFTWPLGGNQ